MVSVLCVVPQPDEKAIGILLRTFWTSQGWREPPVTTREDFAYAKSRGVMFDAPLSLRHDDLVRDVVELGASLSRSSVASAFLASLTSRRLELRSALGSYAIARHLSEHDFVPAQGWYRRGGVTCAVCGLAEVESDIDRNVLNFERFKWGGVRRDDLVYVHLDLQQFSDNARVHPSDEAARLFRELISALKTLPPATTAPRAERALRALPSNKEERKVVLGILGVCGVLESREHRGHSLAFVPAHDRELPPLRFAELPYPVCWWTASDGVNDDALAAFSLPT